MQASIYWFFLSIWDDYVNAICHNDSCFQVTTVAQRPLLLRSYYRMQFSKYTVSLTKSVQLELTRKAMCKVSLTDRDCSRTHSMSPFRRKPHWSRKIVNRITFSKSVKCQNQLPKMHKGFSSKFSATVLENIFKCAVYQTNDAEHSRVQIPPIFSGFTNL